MLTRDARVLFVSRAVRLFAYGFLSVVLALHLAAVGLSEQGIGLLLTLTLTGDAAVSLAITRVADRVGRRRMLLIGAGLLVLVGAVFALTTDPLLLAGAAFVGTLSPTGHEVGAFLSIEQAALAQLAPPTQRTRLFAWYSVVGSFAAALGALSGGALAATLQQAGFSPLGSYRLLFALYAVLGVVMALLSLRLSPRVEVSPTGTTAAPGVFGLHRSQTTVRNLSLLFIIDSFGGALVVQSLIAYWLHLRFGVDPASLGRLFFAVNVVAGFSALVAARIAARVGLINTMVFTHIPANVFLLLMPVMPNYSLAVLMLLLRFSMAQMDVPARQSYLMAVVAPDERSAAAGVVTLARTGASAFGPAVTGLLWQASLLNAPFFLAGALKIAYDLGLYFAFRHIKPPEEIHKER